LPVVVGGLTGLLLNHAQRQARLNRSLSLQNAKLQRQFFTQTLSAHILHEIRNPLHNLAAVIEGWQQQMPADEAAILRRNISRLKVVTDQLSRWNALDESINLREAVPLRPWFEEFFADKVRLQLQQTSVALEHHVDPVVVQMHPLLLEQFLVTLLNNAVEAVGRGQPPRSIWLTARASVDHPEQVEVQICNTGAPFPDAVIRAQGSEPVDSQHGLGLGLMLVRRALEQVGGSLALANRDGQATTTIWMASQAL
jgi:two-component system C4-dicarboxylate transport sensor histidine kinase DctB